MDADKLTGLSLTALLACEKVAPIQSKHDRLFNAERIRSSMKARALKQLAWVAAIILAGTDRCPAPPPMVTGDVPTPDKGTFESYVGVLYQKNGGIERNLPFTELVYGLTDHWELSAELPFVSTGGHFGAGDFALGTKFAFLPETDQRPGMALRYEAKFDNGDAERGLGSGGYEHLLRWHAQKTFGWFTPIINFGGIVVSDARAGGARETRQNVLLANFEQEWRVAKGTKLLSAINWKSSDMPGEPYRLAWNVGFKQKLCEGLFVHGAGGSSFRYHHQGGPEVRLYLGLEYDFDLRRKQ